MTSRLPGFHKKTREERLETVGQWAGFEAPDVQALGSVDSLPLETAEVLSENVIGVFALPLGVATNFRVNGADRLVPMAIEESSVVAAASHAGRLLRGESTGIEVKVDRPIMLGQIQLLDLSADGLEAAAEAVDAESSALLAKANEGHPRLVAAGGGCRDLDCRLFEESPVGPMMIVELRVDVADAMGANAINSMCERLAPEIERITGGRVRLRILSNMCHERLVRAEAVVAPGELDDETCRGIVEASAMAEVDPHRAVTHNKGIMNGVDALIVATGNDWRAVEVAAHSYAARSGAYRPLSTWRIEDGRLVGRLEMPMPVGIIGGATRAHPQAKRALAIAGVGSGRDLAELAGAVGLAQNLAALRALAAEGIQAGHMALHAANVALEAGASSQEVDEISRRLVEEGSIRGQTARKLISELRSRLEERQAERDAEREASGETGGEGE